MLVLSLAILAFYCPLLSVHAQTTNVSTAQQIRTADGTCLSANTSFDGTAVSLRSCDNTKGQRWDVSTAGPHITDDGFAILILSGTSECLDVAAFNNTPGLFSCGGIAGGSGAESLNQAFTYSSYGDLNGPLVLVSKSGWVNSGQGPGQKCLSAEQDVLGTTLCDPSKPTSQQQFFIGSTGSSSTTSSSIQPTHSTSSPSATSPGVKSPSKHSSVNPAAIAVPIVVVALIAILLALFFVQRRRSTKKRDDKVEVRSARPFLATPSISTTSPQFSTTSKGGVTTIGSGSPLTSPPAQTAASSSSTAASVTPRENRARQDTASQPESQPVGNRGDIDHIVSLVAARIDPSTQHHPNPSSTNDLAISNSSAQASGSPSYPSPASSPGLPTSSPSTADTPPAVDVNIDTILSLLAARVDPSFRAQTDVRDSRDLPPGYQVPPGYNNN